MVGVAGRSKGCYTCKKRRIKCDEDKPECARCLKAGYKCAGYAKELVIRQSVFASQERCSNSARNSHKVTQNEQEAREIPSSLSLVAFKESIQHAYLFDNFVWSSYGFPWLQMSAEGKFGPLPKLACAGFAQSTFGRHHWQRDLELDGSVQNSRAVIALRGALSQSTNPAFASLLVPVLILLLHSSSTSNRMESQSHLIGLSTVLQHCGPEAFQQPLLQMAFSSCRATLTTVGLLQKKRLFLEQERWRKLPWLEEKSAQDQLVDILVMLPGFLEDKQALASGVVGRKSQALVAKIMHELSSLFYWRWRWGAQHTAAACDLERNVDYGLEPTILPRLLHFASFARASEVSLYNAVLICLLDLLYSLQDCQAVAASVMAIAQETRPATSQTWSRTLQLPDTSGTLRGPSLEIIRAFEYQLCKAQNCRESSLFWLFPIGIASQVMRHDAGVSAWVQHMLNISSITRGYGGRGNAFGFGFYELFKVG
ncbi:hypothetical protein K431DRAFT_348796 [Polychaeton citri CBS 116435]|uniref:Zn(2)-C6 fungal-type domain-containing protein n=1 Tax=Polychaeton citri CBS 116435 TaxID=1314669 RepID=A0A9P4Q4Q9_9PEZI|nr:hypothetical protein K431DRAFT_348796 [Polychaeton citri CBS 116435]